MNAIDAVWDFAGSVVDIVTTGATEVVQERVASWSDTGAAPAAVSSVVPAAAAPAAQIGGMQTAAIPVWVWVIGGVVLFKLLK